jgi:hypothetical protein
MCAAGGLVLCKTLTDDGSFVLWAHGECEEGLRVGARVSVTPWSPLSA